MLFYNKLIILLKCKNNNEVLKKIILRLINIAHIVSFLSSHSYIYCCLILILLNIIINNDIYFIL